MQQGSFEDQLVKEIGIRSKCSKLTGQARALDSLGPKIKQLYIYKETKAMAVLPSCTVEPVRDLNHFHNHIQNAPVLADQPRVEDHEDPVSQIHG